MNPFRLLRIWWRLGSLPISRVPEVEALLRESVAIARGKRGPIAALLMFFQSEPRQWLAEMGRFAIAPSRAATRNSMEIIDGVLLSRHFTSFGVAEDLEVLQTLRVGTVTYCTFIGQDSIDWFEQHIAARNPNETVFEVRRTANYRPRRDG